MAHSSSAASSSTGTASAGRGGRGGGGPLGSKYLALILRGLLACGQYGFRVFGMCVIFIACALISCVVYVHAHLAIPAMFPKDSVWFWASIGITLWLGTGVWLNYLGSLGCDPGVVPNGFRFPGLPDLHYPPKHQPYAFYLAYAGPKVRGCEACDAHKPPRAHHCSLCGTCVAKMDHHCPWINSCVGYHNQRYFISFLLYLLVGTLYCGVHCGYIMYAPEGVFPPALSDSSMVALSGVICAALHLAMWLFVGWNMHLALSNQTAIEFQINGNEAAKAKQRGEEGYRNPYDLGKWANFVDLFATRGVNFNYYAVGEGAAGPTRYGGNGGASAVSCMLRTAGSYACFAGRRLWHIVLLTWPNVQPMGGDGVTFRSWRASSGPAAV